MATQHAPHPALHSMQCSLLSNSDRAILPEICMGDLFNVCTDYITPRMLKEKYPLDQGKDRYAPVLSLIEGIQRKGKLLWESYRIARRLDGYWLVELAEIDLGLQLDRQCRR